MNRIFNLTRYLVLVPIIGLILAASAYFVIGGYQLIALFFESMATALRLIPPDVERHIPVAILMVEYIHQFLVGTVLYITAIGLYQLFIQKLEVPGWLTVSSTEELETALIGVTVVVLAVHFMSNLFIGSEDLVQQGMAIGAVIAALALYIGLRAWGERQHREAEAITVIEDTHTMGDSFRSKDE